MRCDVVIATNEDNPNVQLRAENIELQGEVRAGCLVTLPNNLNATVQQITDAATYVGVTGPDFVILESENNWKELPVP